VLARISALDDWRFCLEPSAALTADPAVPCRFALEPGVVTSFLEPPAAAAAVTNANADFLFSSSFSSSGEFFFRRASELVVDAVEVDFLRLGASVAPALEIADGRGWIVPAARDGTGPSGTFDGTAVADMILTASLARDAAVGDLFGVPVPVSTAILAADPVGADFVASRAVPEAIFGVEPGGDIFANPPSPPSDTFDGFFVTLASVARAQSAILS